MLVGRSCDIFGAIDGGARAGHGGIVCLTWGSDASGHTS